MRTIVGYHGTDEDIAESILTGKFLCKKNDEHWLGNGVYFFTDYSLAEWWTTNPTKKFGSTIKKPAIIKCTMEVEESNICDLQVLSDFLEYNRIYNEEFLPKLVKKNSQEDLKIKKIRCALCDYIQELFRVRAIIGNFDEPQQPYLPESYKRGFLRLRLPYIETQICVFDQDIIVKKELISMEG